MTDYLEEQTNEVEAMASIYPDEFELQESEPTHKFKILVKSEEYDRDCEDGNGAAVQLVFTYTPTYPDEPPIFEIVPLMYFEEDDVEQLRTHLNEKCDENLGMVMIFTLVSSTQEWIDERLEMDRRKEQEEEDLKTKAQEELERKKFEGTRVTVESFLNWKKNFNAKRLLTESKKPDEKNRKLTGRELFLSDDTLIESDLSFLGQETDGVAVDESLFQDLDDLDLTEELDDDIED